MFSISFSLLELRSRVDYDVFVVTNNDVQLRIKLHCCYLVDDHPKYLAVGTSQSFLGRNDVASIVPRTCASSWIFCFGGRASSVRPCWLEHYGITTPLLFVLVDVSGHCFI